MTLRFIRQRRSAFLSYRRAASGPLVALISRMLHDDHAIDAYYDNRQTDSAGPFPERILRAIEERDVFVCLLGDTGQSTDTLASDWVLREIQHAHSLGKPMIPVFQQSYKPITEPPTEAVAALLQYQGVFVDDERNQRYAESVREMVDLIGFRPQARRIPWRLVGAMVVLLAVGAFFLWRAVSTPSGTATPTTDPRAEAALTQTAVALISTPPTPTFTPTTTSTLTPSLEPGAPPTALSGDDAAQTLFWQGRTATADSYTDTPTLHQTQTVEAKLKSLEAEYKATDDQATLKAIASFTWMPTHTLTPSNRPTPTPLPAGTRNDGWKPVEQQFDGVSMVLVPAGCSYMGTDQSETDELDKRYSVAFIGAESPPHEVCITQPFWIDKYEVSNEQFSRFNGQAGRAGYWTDPQRPRERITWTEANAYCRQRGAQLPTEAQWEYAARGPQSLKYPWGDNYEQGRANINEVASGVAGGVYLERTTDVGSYPGGVSWIGAYDLSGNVWEWVADWYEEQYYQNSPKADPSGPTSGHYRVLRGGS